ncbi:EAL domain-containing protein [Paraburkholderia aromaticivorans]|uniref:EAL domain-containing protein n=1 Tax=Paraburkholderia aromaticivorans TaxID=2026199 RepID=UPI00145622F0|nr:EAL domain-containing protein [Paraburkholderia aromaticivorans]
MNAQNPLSLSSHVEQLFSRLGVGSSASSDRATSLCIVASITNLRQIEQAHGSTFAAAVRHIVGERARTLCDERFGTMTTSGEHILFVFDAPSNSQAEGLLHAPLTAILLDCVLAELSGKAVEVGSAIAFPAISAKVAHFSDAPFDIVEAGSTRVLHGQPGHIWREQFIADTEVAVGVFAAMLKDRLRFVFEPVCRATGSGAVDYLEALLCESVDGTIKHNRLGKLVPALERLGLARRLDRWVVESIIGRLRADPDARLGCNISAQSATLDAWWALTLAILNTEPEVARRLTIEITETMPLTEFAEASEFVRVLRSLGCRVALDDLGGGYSSLWSLLHLELDIAKIDGSFVRAARFGENGAARLWHMVELARACAPIVVVEGIETQADARVARESGATHVQGYLFGEAA